MEANVGSGEVRRDHSRCLVGKFITNSNPPVVTIDERLKRELQRQWSICCERSFDVFPVEDEGLIMVEFLLKRDMKAVAETGIWEANGTALVVKELPSGGSVAEIDFSKATMSVRVKGLPLSHYTQEEARRIGRRLSGSSSKPLEKTTIDPSKRLFFVRAEIDIEKPLNPGYFIGKQRKPIFVQFKYRYNAMLCESCGKVDHTECAKVPEEKPLTRNFKRPMYGRWMYDMMHKPADANLDIEFPEKLVEEWTELEETFPYPQFFINLQVAYVCASDHAWGGKRLFQMKQKS